MLKLDEFKNLTKAILPKDALRNFYGGAWKQVPSSATENPYNNGQNLCDRHNYESCVDGRDTHWDLRGSNYAVECPT